MADSRAICGRKLESPRRPGRERLLVLVQVLPVVEVGVSVHEGLHGLLPNSVVIIEQIFIKNNQRKLFKTTTIPCIFKLYSTVRYSDTKYLRYLLFVVYKIIGPLNTVLFC